MTVNRTYAIILGVVLLVLGIWGFIQAPVLTIFGVNTTQNILHLIGGVLGIWLGTKGGKGFNLGLGWIALVIGILSLIPGVSNAINQVLAINTSTSILYIVIGVVSLLVTYAVKE